MWKMTTFQSLVMLTALVAFFTGSSISSAAEKMPSKTASMKDMQKVVADAKTMGNEPALQQTQVVYSYYDSNDRQYDFRVTSTRHGNLESVEYFDTEKNTWVPMKEETRQPLYCYVSDGKCEGKMMGEYCCEPITATVDNTPTILKLGSRTTIIVIIDGKIHTWDIP